MSYKIVTLFLIYNLFYEFFMNFNFLSKKNIYVCAIDYNLFLILAKTAIQQIENKRRSRLLLKIQGLTYNKKVKRLNLKITTKTT
jgi:hypothetical protein